MHQQQAIVLFVTVVVRDQEPARLGFRAMNVSLNTLKCWLPVWLCVGLVHVHCIYMYIPSTVPITLAKEASFASATLIQVQVHVHVASYVYVQALIVT